MLQVQSQPVKLPPEIIEAVLRSTEVSSYSSLRELGNVTVVTTGNENVYVMKDGAAYFTKLLNPEDFYCGQELHLATWEHPDEAKDRDPRLVYMQRVRRYLRTMDYKPADTADNAMHFTSGDCKVSVKSMDSGENGQHFQLTILVRGALHYDQTIAADGSIDPHTLGFLIHEEVIDKLSMLTSSKLFWWT